MIQIIEKPEGQRYWVVRAQGGDYVQHFRQGSTIAIAHLNPLNLPDEGNTPFVPELSELKKTIFVNEARAGATAWKYRAQTRYGQVRTFVADMAIGDLVVTIDSSRLMVGRIVGHPKIDTVPVRVVHDPIENHYTEMAFDLRRDVNWGPVIKRAHLPTAMKRSISARQTVFNIDNYWESLYHLLYPVFVHNNQLYLSTRIEQKEPISNFSISLLLLVLTELEVFSRASEALSVKGMIDFQELFNTFLENDDFILSTTAEFMSPGSIWSQLGFSDKEGKGIVIGALLFGAIFGVELGPIKIDGVIHKELREQILESFNKRLEIHNVEGIRERLDLRIPNFNTRPLEDSSNDAKPDSKVEALSKSV